MPSKGHHVDPIHIFLIGWAAVEIFFFGGQVYGWPSLVFILKDRGYYQELCIIIHDNSTNQNVALDTQTSPIPTLPPGVTGAPPPLAPQRLGGGGGGKSIVYKVLNGVEVKMDCKEQDFVFQQIFTIATVFTGATLVLNGILFDKAGTLVCRIICMAGCIGSYLMLAFSHPGIAFILYPTITIMEATGFFVMLTNLGLGSLVPKVSGTILAFYHGAFDASACILVVLKLAYSSGVSLRSAYIVMTVLFILTVVPSSFLFLPKFKIPSPAPKHYRTPVLRILSRICGETARAPKPGEEHHEDNDEQEEVVLRVNKDDECVENNAKAVPQLLDNDLGESQQSVHSVGSGNREVAARSISETKPEVKTSSKSIDSHDSTTKRTRCVTEPTESTNDKQFTDEGRVKSITSLPETRHGSMDIGDMRSRVTSVSSSRGSKTSLTKARRRRPPLLHRQSSLFHFVDQGELEKADKLHLHEEDEEHEEHEDEDKTVKNDTADEKTKDDVEAATVPKKVVIKEPMESDGASEIKPKITPFLTILKSPLFISDLIWISLQRFRNWMFLGLFNVWITGLANGDTDVVSSYTSAFQIMQFFGILFSPLSGYLMDRRKKNETNEQLGKIEACFLSFLLDSIVGLLLSIGVCIPIIEVQYVTCFLHVVHRAFLYGPNSAFCAKVFPLQHFGKLFGTYMTVSALFSLIQFPIFILVKGPLGNDPFYLNIALVGVMIFAFAHPIYVYIYCKNLRREDALKLATSGASPKKKTNTDGEKAIDACEMKPLVVNHDTKSNETSVNVDSKETPSREDNTVKI